MFDPRAKQMLLQPVLPLNLLLSGIMFHLSKQSFDEVGLKVRQNRIVFRRIGASSV